MNFKILISALFFIIINYSNSFAFSDKEITQAMKDEINRSLNTLQLESLEKPYYIEYSLKTSEYKTIKAVLGNLTESDADSNSILNVGLRVGNYKFDNSNFLDFGFSFFGSGDDEEQFTNRNVPLDPDYNSLRRELWLATDAAYKQISEIYSKKTAVIKNRMRKDTTHDFLQIIPEKRFDTLKIPQFDIKKFENICRTLSAIFRDYPGIVQSSVGLEYIPEKIIYVNSEGVEYIKTHFYIGLEVVATAQAEDGMQLTNQYTVFTKYPDSVPGLDSLKKAVKNLVEKLVEIRNAKVPDEPYSGPILFEGQAAAQIFAQVFAPNLVTQRMPFTERGLQESDRFTAFQTKIGGRVLPEFLSVNANPTKFKNNNTELLGAYLFDDDGVPAQEVQLVKDGFLKNLLSSRVPTSRVRNSNGHRRGGAPMLSVVELKSTTEHSKSSTKLRERMMQLCKDRELEFGIVVKQILDKNIQFTTLMRLTAGEFSMSRGDNKQALIEVYKVYRDGREELIRGVESKGISPQSFKDILDIGNQPYVLNYLAPSITSSFFSGGSQFVGATIITPDILFEDGEIKLLESDFPKPPILPNPLVEIKK